MALHPFFDRLHGAASLDRDYSLPERDTWKPVAVAQFHKRPSNVGAVGDEGCDARLLADIACSAHGNEIAVSLPVGKLHVMQGKTLSRVCNSSLGIVGSALSPLGFSPTGCCLAATWRDNHDLLSSVKIFRVEGEDSQAATGLGTSEVGAAGSPPTWERSLADR